MLISLLLATAAALAPVRRPLPTIAYSIHLDAAHLDVAELAIELRAAPTSIRLAMKVHAEYDARYWRYVDGMHVEQTADDAAAGVVHEDSTLWRVTLPGGHGVVRYRVHIQPPPSGTRRAWLPYVRADGAVINGPDFFLYLPDFPDAPATLRLDVPRGWRVATALPANGAATERVAPDAMTLLDSPILLGSLREWSFAERGTRYHVVYWPLPDAVTFDSSAFVDGIHRLTLAALDVFRHAPTSDYYFLLQDGAGDALEHRASVTVGVPSAGLARSPGTALPEIAHEFFHTWNLVAIRPAGYNRLSYRAPDRTAALWFGEGVTLYYADVLLRRAGLTDPTPTRLDHLASLLERYYASPAIQRVSPERASLAFGDSWTVNSDATGGYYLQGALLGDVLDAAIRDSTADRKSLDDVMRALFERARPADDDGFLSGELERVIDSICACRMDALFATEIRGAGPIDVRPLLARVGLRFTLDSVPATDSTGQALPDLRLGTDFAAPAGVLRLIVTNPSTAWARAGLQTADELVALNGTLLGTFTDLQAALRRLHIGEHAIVDIRRGGRPMNVAVTVAGYIRPRVRIVDAEEVTPEQRARRQDWLVGAPPRGP